MVAILPYLETPPPTQFDLAKGYQENLAATQTSIRAFLCPTPKDVDTGKAMTHYVAMSGIGQNAAQRPAGAIGNGFMGYDRMTSSKMIKDGTSNTIALMETRLDPGPWARGGASTVRGFDPVDTLFQNDRLVFGRHPDGMNVAFVDGSVHFFPYSIDPKKLAAAITIDGGEEVRLPF